MAFSIKQSLLCTIVLAALCSLYQHRSKYSRGWSIPGWRAEDGAALSRAPDPCGRLLDAEGSGLAADKIREPDRERVNSVIARMADLGHSAPVVSHHVREDTITFCCSFLYSAFFHSTYTNENSFLPYNHSLLLSATRHQQGSRSAQANAERKHRTWSSGESSDSGLHSIQLSDGETVLFSGSVVQGEWNVWSLLRTIRNEMRLPGPESLSAAQLVLSPSSA